MERGGVRLLSLAAFASCVEGPVLRARLSFAMVAVFVGLLALLHLLEPAFIGRLISEYQLSRHGWMMSSAFCSFGVGAMLLAQVIPSALSTRSGRLGRAGLWLVGTALFAAGLLPPVGTRPVVAFVHGVSGLVVILCAPIVFSQVTRSIAHEPAWSGTSRLLRWATTLAWGGLLSFLSFTVLFAGRVPTDSGVVLHPAITLSNRVMITTYCLWFAVAAWGPARRAS